MYLDFYSKKLSLYDFQHSSNVAAISLLFCGYMNYSNYFSQKLCTAAWYHDIGKSLVDESILNKTTELTKEDIKEIRKHPIHSYNICRNLNFGNDILQAVLYHHENYDGGGYPKGLRGEDISLGARVLTIIDNFDAISSDRVYRKGKTIKETLDIMVSESYKFDPNILKEFINFIENENYTLNIGQCVKIDLYIYS